MRGVVVRGGVLVDEDQPVTTTSGLTTPPHRWHRAVRLPASWWRPSMFWVATARSTPRVRQRSVGCVQLGVQVQDVVDVVVEEHLRAAAMISRRAPVARLGWGMSRSCHGASVVLIPPSRRRDSAIPLWYHEAMAGVTPGGEAGVIPQDDHAAQHPVEQAPPGVHRDQLAVLRVGVEPPDPHAGRPGRVVPVRVQQGAGRCGGQGPWPTTYAGVCAGSDPPSSPPPPAGSRCFRTCFLPTEGV